MNLTRKDVESIAHLARLALTEQELGELAATLTRIITFVEQLNTADTSKVEPMAHPLSGQRQRLRSDEVTEHDEHARYQKNAPLVDAALYLVPKVIE
jgi:aspartyl-tRNA(Asn)/glutamyl-tRNA(Gln) amidotransferase subunit C